MDFGTSTTAVDKIDIADLTSFNGDFDTVVVDSTAYNIDEDVLVITSQAFTAVANVDVFLEARSTSASANNGDNIVVIWQDTLGGVHVADARR